MTSKVYYCSVVSCCAVFYPLSLIVVSVTSCCVGLSLRSRNCQTGSGDRCSVVTSTKRTANDRRLQRRDGVDDNDEDGDEFCQLNCDDSSSTIDRAATTTTSTRRAPRVPPVPPPAPINHVDQSQKYLPLRCQKTFVDAGDRTETLDRVRGPASPAANSLPLPKSNVRSSRHDANVGCSLSADGCHSVRRAALSSTSRRSTSSVNTTADGRRRAERIERCVDLGLFVLLVTVCVGLAVCLVFMSF